MGHCYNSVKSTVNFSLTFLANLATVLTTILCVLDGIYLIILRNILSATENKKHLNIYQVVARFFKMFRTSSNTCTNTHMKPSRTEEGSTEPIRI